MSRTTRVVTGRAVTRHRRAAAQRSGGRRLAWSLAGIVGVTGLTVTMTGLTAVSTVGVLTADLPDPTTLGTLTFAQPTIVYDRDATTEPHNERIPRSKIMRVIKVTMQLRG